VNAAQTLLGINGPSTEFSNMLQNRTLTTPKDISDSQAEVEKIAEEMAPARQDAQSRLQACQVFPLGFTTSN
jgi:hypothetical protein